VVVDQDDRVLFIESVDPVDARSVWITPGGALEPGENHVEAALRELQEETGLHDVSVGPWIWTREHIFRWMGRTHRQRERFYLARADSRAIELQPGGGEVINDVRWWTIEELRGAPATTLVPLQLPALIDGLLASGPPKEPKRISG
jgi:ADP-ribose pyrophosphatase YjhB (NUDIX family)